MRVLLIEDNKLVAQVAKKVLETHGTVELVASGEEGLRRLEASWNEPAPYQVAFIDLGLPGLDGEQTVAELRRLEAEAGRGRMPVVVLTGKDDKEAIHNCFEAGCDYYLVKPLSKDKLQSTLKNLNLD